MFFLTDTKLFDLTTSPWITHFMVLRQVVGPGEPFVADYASVGLNARVTPPVARQLVRPGEAPRAALPRASEGLLAGVAPQVGLQGSEQFGTIKITESEK